MKKMMLAGLAALALAACGGDNSDDPVGDATVNAAHGVYQGMMDDAREVSVLVKRNGQYVFLYKTGSTRLSGVLHGVAATTSDRFRTSNATELKLAASETREAVLTATFVQGQYLSGTVDYGEAGTVDFSAAYQQAYEEPANLAALQGQYSARYKTLDNSELTILDIDSKGIFTGSSELTVACNFNGAIGTNGSALLYNMVITFPDPDCQYNGRRLRGTLFHQDAGRYVYGVTLPDDGMNGFFFYGHLPY